MTTRDEQYQQIKSALLSADHDFLTLPSSPAQLHLSQQASSGSRPTIASLSLHPALEAALHLLNNDLPAAHFLVRHAQSAPAWECMYLHGILHRIEGDIQNARCWYGDVKDSEALTSVWSAAETSWEDFLNRVEISRDSVASRKGSKTQVAASEGVDWEKEEEELKNMSSWELRKVLEHLEEKFGTKEVVDSSDMWVQPGGKHADKANAMIVGGEGWREF
ncbi:uncharacterized protein HMPREF1541_05649 [Cyphellophora europaea CBS 101466]|uniref:Uncharacterized protein n=1 Tax=Cyphellophora europaea (strain CBS 101466) TaxID=1220924 RepID=W2RSF1_CYPE1|nr:uncharacterized protein HMPREF1541_05649 [Cyphellophora europaea CBS 101466]ETN39426.1 hypothetical protein HMPREF1541_05649 [Cyphellophora europaea CBS 101466]